MFGLSICLALPWSAVMSRMYPASSHAAASVLPIASTAAEYAPVWPTYTRISSHSVLKAQRADKRTISGGPKLHITNSCSPALSTSATLSATPCTLVRRDFEGRDHVAPSNCFSTPPLKKNVTCAYFSVSADVRCQLPDWCRGGNDKRG